MRENQYVGDVLIAARVLQARDTILYGKSVKRGASVALWCDRYTPSGLVLSPSLRERRNDQRSRTLAWLLNEGGVTYTPSHPDATTYFLFNSAKGDLWQGLTYMKRTINTHVAGIPRSFTTIDELDEQKGSWELELGAAHGDITATPRYANQLEKANGQFERALVMGDPTVILKAWERILRYFPVSQTTRRAMEQELRYDSFERSRILPLLETIKKR